MACSVVQDEKLSQLQPAKRFDHAGEKGRAPTRSKLIDLHKPDPANYRHKMLKRFTTRERAAVFADETDDRRANMGPLLASDLLGGRFLSKCQDYQTIARQPKFLPTIAVKQESVAAVAQEP